MLSTIRKATPEDVSEIARIWHVGWGDGHIGHVPPELVQYRNPEQFLSRAAQRIGGTWVAERASQTVGFVVVKGNEVEQLYVDRPARGTGVAEILLRKGEAEIRATGHEHAWLAVVPGNQRARSFYTRLGWRDTGPRPYLAETVAGPLEIPVHRYERRLTDFVQPDGDLAQT